VSNFAFIRPEWPDIQEAAVRAETEVKSDPRTACFYARRALELEVNWIFKADSSLTLPYEDNLGALLHDPGFKRLAGEALFTKARLITRLGNQAVHSNRRIPESDAVAAVRELFQFSYWMARTYAQGSKPDSRLAFDASLIPDREAAHKQTAEKLMALEEALHERDEKLSALLVDKDDLDAELGRLREEVAVAKKANAELPDDHDYSEAETRDLFIDLLLREAGWLLDQPRDREFEVAGMPNPPGKGFVDYVLWGDDGLPLAVVEAKRTKKDSRIGQRQAELYADRLAKEFGRRPVIFYTNGYTHWLWDDQFYPPREVQGFLTKDELELMIQRRTLRKPLSLEPINTNIVERYYQ
jgi:type I restriction enzyme R subunit